MAGYPYTSQVDDAATRKSLIAAFSLIASLEASLATALASITALQAAAASTPATAATTSTAIASSSSLDTSTLVPFTGALQDLNLGSRSLSATVVTTPKLVSATDLWLAPTTDIKWGPALVALGGGAAPVVGTIGGAGPAVAAQNSWMRALDSAGVAFWVPAWK